MITDKKRFNGFANRATWATVIWGQVDESIYKECIHLASYYRYDLKQYKDRMVYLLKTTGWSRDVRNERHNIAWLEVRNHFTNEIHYDRGGNSQ